MSYIERETALEFVLNNTPHINGETTMKCVERAIKAIPTADVVEVVRCKDCKYCHQEIKWNGKEYFGCIFNGFSVITEVENTHYCSYGERREE